MLPGPLTLYNYYVQVLNLRLQITNYELQQNECLVLMEDHR
jgi:hypothetical protein